MMRMSGYSLAEVSRQTGVRYSTLYRHVRLRERGYSRPSRYFKDCVARSGFTSVGQYSLAISHGINSAKEYKDFLESNRIKRLEGEKIRKEIRGKIGLLIRADLRRLNMTQSYISRCLKVSDQRVSHYFGGKALPTKRRWRKLLDILKLNDGTRSSLEKYYEQYRSTLFPS